MNSPEVYEAIPKNPRGTYGVQKIQLGDNRRLVIRGLKLHIDTNE